MHKAREAANKAIARVTECMMQHQDEKHKGSKNGSKTDDGSVIRDINKFKPNDLVWLESINMHDRRRSEEDTKRAKKLTARRYGPFRILKQVGETSYQLELLEKWKLIHDVFHGSLLTCYTKPKWEIQEKKKPPEPEMVGDKLEYEVEKILDSRRRKRGKSNQMEYLIRWKGYTEEHDSWEPKKNLHAKDLIKQFHIRYPMKLR